MSMRIGSLVPVLALFAASAVEAASSSAPPPPPPPTAEAQLRAINHRFVNAFKVADGDFMNTLTATDFLLTSSTGEWLGRADHLAAMDKPMPLERVSYRDVEVRLLGSSAVLLGVFEAVLPNGSAMRVRYTDVYFWDGGAWRLVSAQNTAIRDGVAIARHAGKAPAHAAWSGTDPVGDDNEVLRQLNESYVESFRRSDVAWYDAHLAPDYISINNDGSYRDRAAALEYFAQPTFATHMKSFLLDKVKIRRFDDVALVHAENVAELKDGSRRVSRYTDIWRKQDGRWRCVAAHITSQK